VGRMVSGKWSGAREVHCDGWVTRWDRAHRENRFIPDPPPTIKGRTVEGVRNSISAFDESVGALAV